MALSMVFVGSSIAHADTDGLDAAGTARQVATAASSVGSSPAGTSTDAAAAESVAVRESGGQNYVGPAGIDDSALFGLSLPDVEATDRSAVPSGESSVFLDPSNKVDILVQPLESGVRIATVLADSSAPSAFSYGLPEGADATANADGSITLSAPAGTVLPGTSFATTESTVVGVIGAAWAFDANGAAVPTSYELQDGQLVQSVDVSSPSIAFPVTADPSYWWGWNLFISHANVGKIVKIAIAAGATAGAVAVGLTAIGLPEIAAVPGAAAAIFALGAALANVCDLNSRGIIIGNSWALNLAVGFTPLRAVGGNFFLSQ